MDDFEITLKVEGTEEAVRALTVHLREDILPEASGIINPEVCWKFSFREVHDFISEDIEGCAADYGLRIPNAKEIDDIMGIMEKRFDANIGMSWDVIAFWIEWYYNQQAEVK